MTQNNGGARVFVVHDEDIIALTLARILQSEGFDATAFTMPIEALQAASLVPPNILITDIILPTLTGIELAIQLKQQCPDCKILLFSGGAGARGLIEDALSNGHHFELLPKPLHPVVLLEKIKSTLELVSPGSSHE